MSRRPLPIETDRQVRRRRLRVQRSLVEGSRPSRPRMSGLFTAGWEGKKNLRLKTVVGLFLLLLGGLLLSWIALESFRALTRL